MAAAWGDALVGVGIEGDAVARQCAAAVADIAVDGGAASLAVAARHARLIGEQAVDGQRTGEAALRAVDEEGLRGLHGDGFDAGGIEAAGGVVVADACAVGKTDDGFVGGIRGLGELVGHQAAEDEAVGGFAAGREDKAVFADAGRTVDGHAARKGDEIGQPVGEQIADAHAHASGGVALGDIALFDEVGGFALVFGGHGVSRRW